MNVFLSAPYTFKLDARTGTIDPGYRQWLNNLLSFLRGYDFDVKCAHEREDWGVAIQPPHVAIVNDMKAISESDLLVVFLGHPPSNGVILELGYAMALKKRMIFLKEKDHELPYLLNGIPACTPCTILSFSSDQEMYALLRKQLMPVQGESRNAAPMPEARYV